MSQDPAELPDSFTDEAICGILIDKAPPLELYNLTCGFAIKLKAAYVRVCKRTKYRLSHQDTNVDLLYTLAENLITTTDLARLHENWTPQSFWEISKEITEKSLNICNDLQKRFAKMPLPVVDPSTGLLDIDKDLQRDILRYHNSLQRPEGAFDLRTNELLQQLVDSPRELCSRCNGRRQVYCGPCGGLRMPAMDEILPPPVSLPFNVLLLVHWQESLVKCTGVHVGAMCAPGTLEVVAWNKEKSEQEWHDIVGCLDPDRDVLLFPHRSAVPADQFDWQPSSSRSGTLAPRRRLVMLEGSWNYAKTMATQILDYRRARALPPIPCVILHDIVGQYWRFHKYGHAAVSTIEAIAHTARAAGLPAEDFDTLLLLFLKQKYRVLRCIEEGGKVPKAVEVSGDGLGSWKALTDAVREIDIGTDT